MRYAGKSETVLAIESLVRSKVTCTQRKTDTHDYLFGIKSVVETRVWNVIIWKDAYEFPMRIFIDGRDNTGVIDVRNKDVWHLCRIDSEVIKLLAQLTEVTSHEEVHQPGKPVPNTLNVQRAWRTQ